MAYQIKRENRVTESLELLDNNGNVAETIDVDINIDAMLAEYRKAQNDIIRAEQKIKENPDNSYDLYGEAVISFFRVIFGTDGTERLLKYFQDNYTEMLTVVMPFVVDVIEPAVKKSVTDKKARMANNYKTAHRHKTCK